MSIVIFLFLSLISFILGIYSFISLPNSIFLFLLFSGIVPTENQFNKLISLKGVYFFDFYFLFIVINYITYLLKSEIKLNRQFILIVFCILFLLTYLTPKLITDFRLDKYILRDFRPFITLIYGAIFFSICYKNQSNIITTNKLFFLLNTIFISKIIVYILLFSSVIKTNDLFYLEENYRYFDFGTYLAIMYIIIYLSNKNLLKNNKLILIITFLFSIILLVISTSRTLLASLILSLFLFSRINIISKLVLITFFSFSFYIVVQILDVQRIKEAFTYSGLIKQLAIRFYPAIEHIKTMSNYQLIFGKGIGTTFQIPWFEYRKETVDPILNNIDSTYFTLYVKYGFLSIILIVIYLQTFTRFYDLRIKLTLILTICIIFITMALPYQTSAIYFIAFSNIFALYLDKMKNTS